MQICGILELQFYEVDTLMFEEVEDAASAAVPDRSASILEMDVILALDHLAHTKNRKLGFHIFECNAEVGALASGTDNNSALVEELLTAGGGSSIALKRGGGLLDQSRISWKVFSNPGGVDSGATVYEAEHLVGRTYQFIGHGPENAAKLLVGVWNSGDAGIAHKKSFQLALASDKNWLPVPTKLVVAAGGNWHRGRSDVIGKGLK